MTNMLCTRGRERAEMKTDDGYWWTLVDPTSAFNRYNNLLHTCCIRYVLLSVWMYTYICTYVLPSLLVSIVYEISISGDGTGAGIRRGAGRPTARAISPNRNAAEWIILISSAHNARETKWYCKLYCTHRTTKNAVGLSGGGGGIEIQIIVVNHYVHGVSGPAGRNCWRDKTDDLKFFSHRGIHFEDYIVVITRNI